ncbi:MAG: 2-oxo acid dehydrogenase subunit E2 [Planctomycetota bacterium]
MERPGTGGVLAGAWFPALRPDGETKAQNPGERIGPLFSIFPIFRLLLPLSLSYDHRVLDGAEAARFLRSIAETLEAPAALGMQGG